MFVCNKKLQVEEFFKKLNLNTLDNSYSKKYAVIMEMKAVWALMVPPTPRRS